MERSPENKNTLLVPTGRGLLSMSVFLNGSLSLSRCLRVSSVFIYEMLWCINVSSGVCMMVSLHICVLFCVMRWKAKDHLKSHL